jgi:hypothetical protein
VFGAGNGGRGTVLVDQLSKQPFGQVLLSSSAVTPGSWEAGEAQYGRCVCSVTQLAVVYVCMCVFFFVR